MSAPVEIDFTPDVAPDLFRPRSIESEQGVLGCIFLSPLDCMGECIEKFKAGSKVFYDLRHQVIYETLAKMFEAQEPIDIITVQRRLKDDQQLEAVGGIGYLASLPDVVPSAANLSFYTNIVVEKFVLRRLLDVCASVPKKLQRHEGMVEEVVGDALRQIAAVHESIAPNKRVTVKAAVHASMNKIEERWTAVQAGGSEVQGIRTGFHDIDRHTGGLHPQGYVVIGARPSMGKTSLAMNIVEHIAIVEKIPVGVISLEMSTEALVMRMLCSRARLNARQLSRGIICERDFPKLSNAAGAVATAPIEIDDSSRMDTLQLRSVLTRMVREQGIKVGVIDYLQKLRAPGRHDNRNAEITIISGEIKAIAKDLNIPLVVLAQLNRELEKEKARAPRMADLREGGAIEQDADFIGFLWKEADSETGDFIPVNLRVAKQRDGARDFDIKLTLMPAFTRFESAAPQREDEF